MTNRKPLTETQRKHHYYMGDAMRRLEWDIHNALFEARRIPKGWHDISTRREAGSTRVTIRLDADVVKFFKAMGPGYQPRINRVLRTFMHYRLAGIIEGPDTTDYVLHPETLLSSDKERPRWGGVAHAEAAMKERLARDMKKE